MRQDSRHPQTAAWDRPCSCSWAPPWRSGPPRRVLGAVAGLVQVLLIAAAVIVGVGAAGLVGPPAWRWRRIPLGAARARSELHRAMLPLRGEARAVQPLPAPPRSAAVLLLPARGAGGIPAPTCTACRLRTSPPSWPGMRTGQPEAGHEGKPAPAHTGGRNGRYARRPGDTGRLPGLYLRVPAFQNWSQSVATRRRKAAWARRVLGRNEASPRPRPAPRPRLWSLPPGSADWRGPPATGSAPFRHPARLHRAAPGGTRRHPRPPG
jgi:hypothetical protein